METMMPHPTRSTFFLKEDDMVMRTTPPTAVPSSSSSSSTPLSLEQTNLLKFKIEVLLSMLALEEKKSQRMMALLSQRNEGGNPSDNTDDSQYDMIGAMDRMRFEFRDNRSNIIKSFADEEGNVVACMSREEFQRQLYASTESVSKADVRFFSIRFFDGNSVCVTEFLDYFLTPAATRAAKAAANAVRMSVRLLEIRHGRSTPSSSSIVARSDDDNNNRIRTDANDMETPKALNNSKFQHPRSSTSNLSQSQEQEQRKQTQQSKHDDKVTELGSSFRDDPPNEDVIDRSVLFSKGTVEELEDCVDINDDDDFADDSPVVGTVAKTTTKTITTTEAAEAKVAEKIVSVSQSQAAETSENSTSRDKEETVTTSIPQTLSTHAHSVEGDVEKKTDDNGQLIGGSAVTSDSGVSPITKVGETDATNSNVAAPPVEVKEISSVTITAVGKLSTEEASADDVPATKTTWSSRLSTLGGRMIGKGGQKDGAAATATTTTTVGSTAAPTVQPGMKDQEKTAASGEAPVPKGILKGVASSIYQSSAGLGSRMLGRKEETAAPSPERKTSAADTEGSLPDSTQPKGSTASSIFQASKRKMFSFGRTTANPN